MLVAAQLFDGEPFKIHIPSLTAVAAGGTAKIIIGHMIHKNDIRLVAVKVFKTMLSDTEQMLLRRELEIARQVSGRHRFIAEFIGTADIGFETSIVSLYMANGNLLNHLLANQDADRKRLILQVAEAVVFLHSDEGLVHGDLKCANVLISDSGDALLADFGLSTFVEKAESSATTATDARTKHTLRFAAPELLLDAAGGTSRRRSKTRETDVYAFGMLVLEALTERSPWAGLTDVAVLLRVHSGKIPSQPTTDSAFASISHAWWDICERCWSYEPNSRPAMKTVLDYLTLHDHEPCEYLQDYFWHLADLPRDRIIDIPVKNVVQAAYMPCGQRLVLSTYQYGGWALWIYDIASGNTVSGPQRRQASFHESLVVSADGHQIAAAASDDIVRWDVLSGSGNYAIRCVRAIDGMVVPVISPDTKLAAFTDRDTGRIRLRDAITGEPVGEPLGRHLDRVHCVAFSPDGTRVVTASFAEELFVWNISTGEKSAAATEPGAICCVLFLPNGEQIVTGSPDGKIRIWNAGTLELERIVAHPTPAQAGKKWVTWVTSVSTSPSGKYIASVSGGKTFQIWETETWQPLGMPKTRPGSTDSSLMRVEFSPSGKSFICVAPYHDLILWDLVE